MSHIAIQIGFNDPQSPIPIGLYYDLNSINSNEQLVFKSHEDNRTNMNTNELRDEISMKLNPQMYRQMVSMSNQHAAANFGHSWYEDETQNNKFGKLISEIPEEEDEESMSSSSNSNEESEEGCDDEDEEDDDAAAEESKERAEEELYKVLEEDIDDDDDVPDDIDCSF